MRAPASPLLCAVLLACWPGLAPAPCAAQASGAPPPSPLDEVHALELTADDPALIDGRGPTQLVELEIRFSGTLHLWTRSELDLFLQVVDPESFAILAEDDDSGGGNVPYLERTVEEGDRLAVLIASTGADALGSFELHVVAAPETETTREAALRATGGLAEARRLQQEGDLDAARSRIEALVSELLSTPGSAASELVAEACWQLGQPAKESGDLASCLAAWKATRDHRERTLPSAHPDLLGARQNLAATMRETGDLPGARALEESVLAARERTLPEDHPALLDARRNLAVTRHAMGDRSGARALLLSVLSACERTLPEGHPDLLAARQNAALVRKETGDLPGARALEESVLAARERTLPEDHPDLLAARRNLAGTLREMGDLPGARALFESVLAARERTLPEGNPNLLAARLNVAVVMKEMGDLPGSCALEESVLAAREQTLPEGHPDLLLARQGLAGTMWRMGDLPGARALEESVLAARERTLPEDHPDLLDARQNLAGTLWKMGDLRGARALFESVLASRERTLPEDHPDRLAARQNLAAAMKSQGDLSGARALYASVLADYERTLPEGHPDLLAARQGLAATMGASGDLPAARALEESLLASYERTLPEGHPELLAARGNLAVTMAGLGDLTGARGLVGPQVAGVRARVLGSLTLAPRQAREVVAGEAQRLAEVLFLTRSTDADLQGPVFELQETMRMVAGEAARALRAVGDPRIRSLLDQVGAVRGALGDLSSRSSDLEPAALSAELTRLLQERDRLEREASRLQAERGVETSGVEIASLAHALGEGAALVTYRRIEHWDRVEGQGPVVVGSDHLLAHVLAADGSLVRLDLGEASELEGLVTAWRAAVGAPLLRGLAAEEEEGDRERAAGEALRARLLDPVLAVLDERVERLHVCADDLVYLVPLDALPFEQGRVGDRWSLVNEVSCARLSSTSQRERDGKGLLALGGVDYDAGEETAPSAGGESAATRSAMPEGFSKLLQTRFEAETTGALAEDLLEVQPVVLTKKEATKAALFERAPGKRWLHLATHGWFADEALKSTLDEEPAGANGASGRGWTSMSTRERVTGMAPMLLCGLALAGANRPMDSLGRRPGILTAEELCSLDLSSCELAVLSACETNVGIRRAGQGIQSLQAALYAAGAKSSITSLWKVDDAATRRLFELFYTKLWEEKLPKAEALWQAKRALRDEGAPVRDWAAWVLTGDPE